jgi:carbon storage regulator
MIVLSRKETESVLISDNVVVTVLCIQDDEVQLGIEAPVGMPVHRKEVHEAMKNRGLPANVG